MAKVFNDPIHGHILLDAVLVKIINTPEFQRLRNIKQLGGVYFVYPGASHNRFEHSIGVAYLSGELAKALKMKQLEQIKPLQELKKLKKLMELKSEDLNMLKKLNMLTTEELEDLTNMKKLQNMKPEALEKMKLELEKFQKLNEFEPKDLEKLEESLISDEDILCVQIAGLCHDLGHGPFSHLFDRLFMPEADKEDNGKWEHENASIEMFDHLLKKPNGLKEMLKNCGLKIEEGETDLKFIQELIKGPPKDESQQELPYEGRKKEKAFLYEIVSNKETGIDVDKFDYFARDCHHLGIQNNFDHHRFIMFARVCDVEEDGSKIKHICSRDKEVANLYDIFQQRHSIHRRACKHKIAVAVEIMIKDALVLADKDPYIQIEISNGSKVPLSKAKEEIEAYIKLTDQVFERILNSCSPSLKEAREIAQRVMSRDLYRCVGQARLNDKDEKEKMENKKEELRKELLQRFPEGGEKNFEVIDVTFDYGMKNKDPMSKAYVYSKANPDKGQLIIKSKVSRLLPERFSDEKLMVYWKNYEKAQEKEREKKEREIKVFFQSFCEKKGLEDAGEEDD